MRKLISSLFILSVTATLSVFTACNKLSKSTTTPDISPIIVKNNVVVIDTTQYTLTSTANQLTQGTYVFLAKSPTLADLRHNGDFATGNIIVGYTGQGYLRKITEATSDAQTITLTTEQARLEDIFQQGLITFNTGTPDNSIFQYNFSKTYLSFAPDIKVQLTGGSLLMNTLQNFTLQFANGKLSNLSTSGVNNSLAANLQLIVNAANAGSFLSNDNELQTFTTTSTIWAGKIPLVITTEINLVANLSGTASGAVNDTLNINNNEAYNFNTVYNAGAWTNTNNFLPATILSANVTPGALGITATCSIIPQVNIKFYGVTGSSLAFPYNSSITGNKSATTVDWDFSAGLFLQPTISEVAGILGYSLPDYNTSWATETATYISPYQLVKFSGDHQTGAAGNYLPKPVEVKVTDNKGNKQPGVLVTFAVTSGGGSMSYYTATSDANGIVVGYWQLGTGIGTQTLSASARKADGTNIAGSPVVFTAN